MFSNYENERGNLIQIYIIGVEFSYIFFPRKLGNQSKPLVTVAAVDDKTLSFKQQSLVKTTEFSCQIGVPFEETTADGRNVI